MSSKTFYEFAGIMHLWIMLIWVHLKTHCVPFAKKVKIQLKSSNCSNHLTYINIYIFYILIFDISNLSNEIDCLLNSSLFLSKFRSLVEITLIPDLIKKSVIYVSKITACNVSFAILTTWSRRHFVITKKQK